MKFVYFLSRFLSYLLKNDANILLIVKLDIDRDYNMMMWLVDVIVFFLVEEVGVGVFRDGIVGSFFVLLIV